MIYNNNKRRYWKVETSCTQWNEGFQKAQPCEVMASKWHCCDWECVLQMTECCVTASIAKLRACCDYIPQ
jgi:hypothetical protein